MPMIGCAAYHNPDAWIPRNGKDKLASPLSSQQRRVMGYIASAGQRGTAAALTPQMQASSSSSPDFKELISRTQHVAAVLATPGFAMPTGGAGDSPLATPVGSSKAQYPSPLTGSGGHRRHAQRSTSPHALLASGGLGGVLALTAFEHVVKRHRQQLQQEEEEWQLQRQQQWRRPIGHIIV